jgi:hypothetical protein
MKELLRKIGAWLVPPGISATRATINDRIRSGPQPVGPDHAADGEAQPKPASPQMRRMPWPVMRARAEAAAKSLAAKKHAESTGAKAR